MAALGLDNSHTRVTTAAINALKTIGMKPDDVPFLQTGKSGLEHIITEITKAIISDLQTNGIIKVTLKTGLEISLAKGVPVPTDGGVALLATQVTGISTDLFKNQSEGTIE